MATVPGQPALADIGARVSALTFGCVLAAAATAAAGPIIDVQGSTAGCFGSGCGSFTSPATSAAAYGLTFTGTPFDQWTDAAGTTATFLLGTLSRGNVNTPDSTPAASLTLELIFGTPGGIAGGQTTTFTASINGVNHGGGGPLALDFDNSWTSIAYSNALGSGSFDIGNLLDGSLTKNGDFQIFAAIRNASFTPARIPDVPAEGEGGGAGEGGGGEGGSVPEPASLALMGSGILGALLRRRRSR